MPMLDLLLHAAAVVYPLGFKLLMELIIFVFNKLMGAAIRGHWNLRDTGTTRDYDTLARSLGWLSGATFGWATVVTMVTLVPTESANCWPSLVDMTSYLPDHSDPRFESGYCGRWRHSSWRKRRQPVSRPLSVTFWLFWQRLNFNLY